MRDPIERQAAIDVIQRNISEISFNARFHANPIQENSDLIIFGMEIALELIKKLPSVVGKDTTNIDDTINNKQPELKVPISWIKENIHSLKAMENTRTFLTEMDVPTLINRLKEERIDFFPVSEVINANSSPELADIKIGKSKSGITMWYECGYCGESIDIGDKFCRNCGRRLIYE